MKLSILLTCLIMSLASRGQLPDSCKLLQLTLNNDEFVRLLRIDTTGSQSILIADPPGTFNKCGSTRFTNRSNSFDVKKISRKEAIYSGKRYLYCIGLSRDDEDTSQYSMLMYNFISGRAVIVYYALKNKQWVIDHFVSEPSNPWAVDNEKQ